MQTILAQLALEVFKAYMKARAAAAAEGADLDRLLSEAAADNDVSIWEALGVEKPGDEPAPTPDPVPDPSPIPQPPNGPQPQYSAVRPLPIPDDDALRAEGFKAGDLVGANSEMYEVAKAVGALFHTGIRFVRVIA